jgi:hypothetical protein
MSERDRRLRDIMLPEWDAYEWIDARHIGSSGPEVVRGRRKDIGPPPDDGYAYQREGDTWMRVRTASPPVIESGPVQTADEAQD